MALTSLTSAVTNIQYLDNIGFQFDFTGSPVGIFTLQVSADYVQDPEGNVLNSGSWAPLSVTYSTSTGSPIYVDNFNISAPYMRAVYTKTSGTGTLNAYVTGKEV